MCATCHQAHSIQDPTTIASREEMPHECGNCHDDLVKSFHDSFHGKSTDVGRKAAATCSDCHTPHQNLPASDPRSTINPDNLADTCGSAGCHQGKVNASFLTFMPHSEPMNAERNPWVHYIYLFMTLLLLGVFGFFGLHAFLWLQRTLVGRLRGEFKVEHGGPGPYVRRFTTTQMWLHVSIILSFLLLSVTGLPLKFATAPWAPGLMKLLGGPEVACVAAPLRRDRDLRLLRRAPGDAVPRHRAQEEERLLLGLAVHDPAAEGRPGHVGQREVLPVHGPAAVARSLVVLGEVRLPRGLLGRRR